MPQKFIGAPLHTTQEREAVIAAMRKSRLKIAYTDRLYEVTQGTTHALFGLPEDMDDGHMFMAIWSTHVSLDTLRERGVQIQTVSLKTFINTLLGNEDEP